jgi:hypothetical protein
MWSGNQGNGLLPSEQDYKESDKDTNLLFKIYKDSKGTPRLWLGGNAEFNGKVFSTAGEIGGWRLETNGFTSIDSGISLTSNGLDLGGISFTSDDKHSFNFNSLTYRDTFMISNGESDGLFFGEPKGTITKYKITLEAIERTNKSITIKAAIADGAIPFKAKILKLYYGRYSPSNLIFGGSSNSGYVEIGFTTDILEHEFTLSFDDIGCEDWHTDYLGFSVLGPNEAVEVAKKMVNTDVHCDTLWGPYEMANDDGGYAFSLSDSLATISCNYSIEPSQASTKNLLGSETYKWSEVWANTFYGDTSQSDFRVKNNISSLPQEYEIFFDKMVPVKYKYNNGTSNRYHTGFIAQ